MKQSLLTITACAFVSVLSAQITITQNDIAPLYSNALQNNDTIPTVLPGPSGASQTWNFMALNAHSTDTLLFTLPQFTPDGSSFPGSNLSVAMNTNQAYLYFNSSPAEFNVQGQAADPFGTGVIVIPFSDPEKQLEFPTTYNSSFTDTAYGYGETYLGYDPGVGFPVDSVHVHATIIKTSVIDAWGSLTTPLGTYNVLRQNTIRREIYVIDFQAFTIWTYDAYTMEDSARTYTYWANGIGFPIAQLTDDQDLGTITSATWIPALPQQTAIHENAAATNLELYPNPSAESVTFVTTGTQVASISILDVNGKIVRTASVLSDKTKVNVSDLATGIYFYQANDANGNVLNHGKLNVAH